MPYWQRAAASCGEAVSDVSKKSAKYERIYGEKKCGRMIKDKVDWLIISMWITVRSGGKCIGKLFIECIFYADSE